MFTLRDFCEPGDSYTNFVTGEQETITENPQFVAKAES